MGYSSQTQVDTWLQNSGISLGQKGYTTYDTTIAYLISVADRAIDDETMQPETYFTAGGVTLTNEYHDGVEIGDYGLLLGVGLRVKPRPFLRLKYSPIISVTTVQKCDSQGNWTTLTQGYGNDYIALEEGIRFLQNIPSYNYKNVRVTYVAGHVATPSRISECSARLAAAIGQRIIDSQSRHETSGGPTNTSTPDEHKGLAKAVFTDELKRLVRNYRRKVPIKML